MDARRATFCLSSLAKAKRAETAYHLLGSLHALKMPLNQFHFSAAITACEKAARWDLALELLSEMLWSKIAGDNVAYNAAISACARGGEWQRSLSLLTQMEQSKVLQDSVTYGAAISACERTSQWQRALTLKDKMLFVKAFKDVVIYNTLISACHKGQQWQRALILFGEMVLATVPRDTVSYNSTISACEHAGQWQVACSLFFSMPSISMRRSSTTYNATITACDRGHQWEHSLALLSSMAQPMRDVISYNLALSGCGRAAAWQHVVALMADMALWRVDRNEITYMNSLNACDLSRQWMLALHYFEEMSSSQLSMSKFHLFAVLGALQDRPEGPLFLAKRPEAGLRAELLQGVIGAHGQESAALNLFGLHRGAAKVVVKWWLLEVVPPLLKKPNLGPVLEIYADTWDPRQSELLRQTVAQLLEEIGMPLVPASSIRRFAISVAQLRQMMESR